MPKLFRTANDARDFAMAASTVQAEVIDESTQEAQQDAVVIESSVGRMSISI